MSIPSIVAAGQRLLGTALLDSCVIGDRTVVRDSRGGSAVTWTDRDETEDCWFTQISDDLPVIAANSETFGAAVALLILALGTDIDEGDRVTNLQDNSVWIVTRNITAPSALAISTRVGIRVAEAGEAS